MGEVLVGLWVPTPVPWDSSTCGVLALSQANLPALALSAWLVPRHPSGISMTVLTAARVFFKMAARGFALLCACVCVCCDHLAKIVCVDGLVCVQCEIFDICLSITWTHTCCLYIVVYLFDDMVSLYAHFITASLMRWMSLLISSLDITVIVHRLVWTVCTYPGHPRLWLLYCVFSVGFGKFASDRQSCL